MSQLIADLTPERAQHLQEHGETLTRETLEFLADKFETAQQVLDEIAKQEHEGIEPVVIFDRKTETLVLLWGKK